MTSFIAQVLRELTSRNTSISEYIFVLPSKRAGSYLINQLAALTEGPMFSPKVLSIEDFAEEIAGLKAIDNTSALFEFYTAYLACTPEENRENFDTFAGWAQTLLYDFNEIDRYLIDYKSFFGYLSDIQEINHWYLQEERTALMENYLSFWRRLPQYYEQLKSTLEEKDLAYQGMVYRRASEKVGEYIKENKKPHVFLGFNALNHAEQHIFQSMLEAGVAEVFWDIEETFLNDPQHDASLFIRQYLKEWPYYSEHEPQKISNSFSTAKKIRTVGVPGNVGQAKYIGELLAKLDAEELKKTAVVLGDEGLLLPVLNSLPQNVEEINVTMGFPLKNAPVTSLFDQLLEMHSSYREDLYYRDVMAVSNHPLIQKITSGFSHKISAKIQQENMIYFKGAKLYELIPEEHRELFRLFFDPWSNDPLRALQRLQEILFTIRQGLKREEDTLTLEFLYQYNLLFNKLLNLLNTYPHVRSIKSLLTIYKELLASQTVDFRGKPFTGLQLMGMLESRVLDFENIIVTSVNEGILPAGKSSNSFIPYDLKCSYKLPTYKEKDAVYTYHFYHLLQRSNNVVLLYNTESGGLNGGEKSRFLLQLEMERKAQHDLLETEVAPKVPAVSASLKQVQKTPAIMDRIRQLAGRGFSPSALTTYIRNPLDFYQQYILGVKEREEIEETVAFNTLGTVVHDTLEVFYKNWEGKELKPEDLKKAISLTRNEVAAQFQKTYTREPLSRGKNLLIFEVAGRYVSNLLKMDIHSLKEGNVVKILEVENNLKEQVRIDSLDFPVYLRGKVDRVDEFNGITRVIDYKTGKVDQRKVELVDWEDLTTDYDKFGKTFQILSYAWLLDKKRAFPAPVEAGIISFKNMQEGFLCFSKKDRNGHGAKKDPKIDGEVLESYRGELEKLIIEICNPEFPFVEKEIPEKSW